MSFRRLKGLRPWLNGLLALALILSLGLPAPALAASASVGEAAKVVQDREVLIEKAEAKLKAKREAVLRDLRDHAAVRQSDALSESAGTGERETHRPDKWVRVIVTLEGPDVLSRLTKAPALLSPAERRQAVSLSASISRSQEALLNRITGSSTIDLRIRHRFVETMNGFSADIRYGDIPKLRAMPGVVDVALAETFYPDLASKNPDRPDMYFSAPLIGAAEAWSQGYEGEGIIVAVVDSGINYFHPAFGGTGRETLKLGGSEDLTEKGGYNERVIGGYNWADDNNDIVDRTDSQHGVHVAGTVGGYDDTPSGVINGQPFRGVAPKVKFLAEKVFSNDPDRPSTTSDEYIAAVDHAVRHGAHVINISLGSPAGAFNPEDPFYQVMKKASEKGVVFSISAGNNDRSTGSLYPFVENPDVALVGSPSINPPSISVAASMNAGAYYDNGAEISVRFDENRKVEVRFAGDTITSFSSWGYEPSLILKPTLTAPGGSITSSVGAKEYASFNGTSMAASHVSGAAALVIERFKKDGIAYGAADVRAALANTAKILMDPRTDGKLPYPIRQQGAGRIQVDKAIKTDVLITVDDQPAAGLGAFTERERQLTVTLRNVGKTDRSFAVKGMLFTDATAEEKLAYRDKTLTKTFDLLKLQTLEGLELTPAVSEITVPAGGTVQLNATVHIPDTLSEDRFVEGWLTFQAPEGDGQPDLILPVYGFYGDWGRPPVIDSHWTSEDSYARYYLLQTLKADVGGISGLYDEMLDPLGVYLNEEGRWVYSDDYAAISPAEGARNNALTIATFLRNAKQLEVRVVDSTEKVLRTLLKREDVRKNDLKSNPLFKVLTFWDGQIAGQPVPDGPYAIEIVATPYAAGARPQITRYPVKVVSKPPEVTVRAEDEKTFVVEARTEAGIEAVYAVAYDLEAGWSKEVALPAVKDEAAGVFRAVLHPTDLSGFENGRDLETFAHTYVYFLVADTAGNLTFDEAKNDVPFILNDFSLEGSDLGLSWSIDERVKDVLLKVETDAEIAEAQTYEASASAWAAKTGSDWREGLDLPLPYGARSVELRAVGDEGQILATRTLSFSPVNAIDKLSIDPIFRVPPNVDRYEASLPYRVIGEYSDRLEYAVRSAQALIAEGTVNLGQDREGKIKVELPVPSTSEVEMKAYAEQNPYGEGALQTGAIDFQAQVDYVNKAIFAQNHFDVSQEKDLDTLQLEILYAPDVQNIAVELYDPYTGTSLDTLSASVPPNEGQNGRRVMTLDVDLTPYRGMLGLGLQLKVDNEPFTQDWAYVYLGETGILKHDPGTPQILYTADESVNLVWNIETAEDALPDRIEIVRRVYDLDYHRLDEAVETVDREAIAASTTHTTSLDLSAVPDKGEVDVWVTAYRGESPIPVGRLSFIVRRSLSVPLPTVGEPEPFGEYNARTGREIVYQAYFPVRLADFVDFSALKLQIQTDDGWKDVQAPVELKPVHVDDLGYVLRMRVTGIEAEKEGFQNIRLYVRDKAGNEAQVNRKFYVDMTPPTISVDGVTLTLNEGKSSPDHRWYEAKKAVSGDTFELKGTVSDERSSFTFYIDDDVVLGPKDVRFGSEDRRSFSRTVTLDGDQKTVTLLAVDGVGNKATAVITLVLSAEAMPPGGGGVSEPSPVEPSPIDQPTPPPPAYPDPGQGGSGGGGGAGGAGGGGAGGGGGGGGAGTPPVGKEPVKAGELVVETTETGKALTLNVSPTAFEAALKAAESSGSDAARLNLTDVELKAGDALTVRLAASELQALTDRKRSLTLELPGLTVRISNPSAWKDAAGNFVYAIKVRNPAAEARIAARYEAHFISPIYELSAPAGTSADVAVSIKADLGGRDWRKAALYRQEADGAWRFAGGRVDPQSGTIQATVPSGRPVAALVYERTFDDLAGHWAKDIVEVTASQHLVKGRSSTTFDPNAPVTRAEFATMLLNALGIEPKAGSIPFADVDPAAWYAPVVATAYAQGIAKGDGKTFRPNAPIERQEMAVMFAQALKLTPNGAAGEPKFVDADRIAPWARPAVGLLAESGYLSGRGEGRFVPLGTSTRAEAATLLYQWWMRR